MHSTVASRTSSRFSSGAPGSCSASRGRGITAAVTDATIVRCLCIRARRSAVEVEEVAIDPGRVGALAGGADLLQLQGHGEHVPVAEAIELATRRGDGRGAQVDEAA